MKSTAHQHHTSFHGIPIVIENPAGELVADHGYIKKTTDHDGDPIDVFVGPHKHSDKVFIIDQYHRETGTFDEHKCLLGFNSEREALSAYRNSYSRKYLKRFVIGSVAKMSVADFKAWLEFGNRNYLVAQSAFKFPRDFAKALGRGDKQAGHAAIDRLFGRLTTGRRIVEPIGVSMLGDGNEKKGRRVLKRFVNIVRSQHRAGQ